MPSRALLAAWAFFDTVLLASGILAVVFSILWHAPNNTLRMLVITQQEMTAGLTLGTLLLFTFVFSIPAILFAHISTPTPSTKSQSTSARSAFKSTPLTILNILLIIDTCAVIVVGTMVWWATLQERSHFGRVFDAASVQTRSVVQDQLHCCGYWSGNDTSAVGAGFCNPAGFANLSLSTLTADAMQAANTTQIQAASAALVQAVSANTTLASGVFAANVQPCVGPLTAFADSTLNDVFTSIYGFAAGIIGLFLSTLCVIKQRRDEERFKKIDAKRGGRGFV